MGRKNDVIMLKCLGFKTKEIAERVGITMRGVQHHLKKLLGNRGRTSNTPMYTEDDVLIIMMYPDYKDVIGKRRFREYYERQYRGKKVLDHQNLAGQVLRRDDYTCTVCGEYRNLECHHVQNPGSLNMDDCVTVCKDCHHNYEKRKKGGEVGDG